MCIDPISMISIAGGVAGAAGSLVSGAAGSQAAGANANQALVAAAAARANAGMALDYGEGKVAQINQRVGNAIGAARAFAGAGNLAVNSGSPLAVQAMSAAQGNTDKQLALAGALNQAAGQNFAGAQADQSAVQDYRAQGYDMLGGLLGAGTAALRGIASIRGGGVAGGGGLGLSFGY